MRRPIRITTEDGQTEELEVSEASRYDFPGGETGWDLKGLDPSETELLEADLKWMSGMMADRPSERVTSEGEPKYPSVYVPDDYGVTIEVLTHTNE